MLYVHATIITVDANRQIIPDGAIFVKQDTIADIGKTDLLTQKYPSAQQYNLQGCVVIPGLVSTHVHTVQTLLRGTADGYEKQTWLRERILPLQRGMTEDDAQIAVKISIAEMLKSGTTCFLECLFFEDHGTDQLCQTVQDSGIRACVAQFSTSFFNKAGVDEELLLNMLGLHNRWNGAANDRIRTWFAAANPEKATEAQMRKLRSVAEANGMGTTIHLAECSADTDYLATLGHTPSSYAESVGFLSPSTVLAHVVAVDKELDIPKLAVAGAHVSHCPSSNSKLGSGISPVPELLAAGINVSLGCDGAGCNNSLDLLQELKWAALVHSKPRRAAEISAETAIEMATINGAKALGLDHLIGSLEIGKRADFVAVNVRNVALQPCINPVSNIVYAATGRDVHLVVVDGKPVVENGKLLTLDEDLIMESANQALGCLLQRTDLHDKVRSSWPTTS